MKWMKFASVLGFILSILCFALIVFTIYGISKSDSYFTAPETSLFSLKSSSVQPDASESIFQNPVFIMLLMLISIILLCAFYYGAFRLGRSADSPLLSFGARWLILSIILGMILSGITTYLAFSLNFNLMLIFIILLSLLSGFSIFANFVFWLGFIDLSGEIPKGKVAGIFGISVVIFSISLFFLQIFSVALMPVLLLTSLSQTSSVNFGSPSDSFGMASSSILAKTNDTLNFIKKVIIVFLFIFEVLLTLSFLFASLTLLEGSRKYESASGLSLA